MPNEEDKPLNEIIKNAPADLLSAVDGIPLPSVVKKNLWKSIGALITGAVNIPVSYFESISQRRKSESDALALFTNSAAQAAAGQFAIDKDLTERAVNHFASKLFREQKNREEIINKAVKELAEEEVKEDTKEEIDADWLDMFSRIAETKSNEDVQLFMAKILAGEIRKPGTFTAKTVHTLSILDQETAAIFQSLCNVSFSIPHLGDIYTLVMPGPIGDPNTGGLSSINLGYANLLKLQEAGLIQSSLSSYYDIKKINFTQPFTLGADSYQFKYKYNENLFSDIRFVAIVFTKTGLELRRVLHLTSLSDYNYKTLRWLENVLEMELL